MKNFDTRESTNFISYAVPLLKDNFMDEYFAHPHEVESKYYKKSSITNLKRLINLYDKSMQVSLHAEMKKHNFKDLILIIFIYNQWRNVYYEQKI